jgi:ATP-dependent Clp protease protease subunit
MAASMGALLLAGGAKGKRFALTNAEIMIHQPSGGIGRSQASDFEIHAKRIIALKEKLNRILAQATGQPVEKVAQDSDRDNFLTAEEALEYGLIDKIVSRKEEA